MYNESTRKFHCNVMASREVWYVQYVFSSHLILTSLIVKIETKYVNLQFLWNTTLKLIIIITLNKKFNLYETPNSLVI